MYVSLRGPGSKAPDAPRTPMRGRFAGVGRNVLLLGLVSMVTDVSSEMVASTLPLYLTVVLRFTPLEYGVLDGLYQGVTALVRLAGGVVADRWHRYKEVAAAGYGLSALCKLALLAAGGVWTAFAGVILLDRVGKGIRTPPRDALISLSSTRERLGEAFGVHRALDTAGAMLGPLVAFGLLAVAPDAFDAVFVVSFCFAALGVGILLLLVENRPPAEPAARTAVALRSALALLRAPRFRAVVLAGAALSLMTVSDGFAYLVLQRRLDLGFGFFPLLYVGTSAVYLLLAVPAGRLADRIGRGRTVLGGHALLLVLYLLLLGSAGGIVTVLACLALLGAYYAATDGVLMALGSALLPEGLRSSGLALLATAAAMARLAASVLFGATWSAVGQQTALLLFGAGLVAALVISARLLPLRGTHA
jgi:MFS family permease